MGWSSLISSGDVVAIHAALVPGANGDGEILLFGGDNHDQAAARMGQFDHTRRFNCRHVNQPLLYVHSPAFDLFCCGHAFLGNGRLLAAGGTAEFLADAGGNHLNHHYTGHRHAVAYSPMSGTFVGVADMGARPGTSGTGGGRWYPTLCTLGTGEVFAFQGHPRGDDLRHGNNTPERYQSLTNSWVMLPAVGDVGTPGSGSPILYPRLHLLRNGHLFVSSDIPGYTNNIQINPYSGAVQEISPLPDAEHFGICCPSVLLPLVPGDGYQPRVLFCGGLHSQMIDLGNPEVGWLDVPRNGTTADRSRFFGNATLLPTGDVLFTGGITSGDTRNRDGVMEPEIYRTPFNPQTGVYTAGTGHWNTIDEPATVVRNYHSTALLMPDGRVWTSGGNSAAQPLAPPTNEERQIEIYDPPYPAGPRTTISDCPSFVAYGDTFSIGVPVAENIGSVVLMRCGSSTHAFDPDQRAVYLQFHPEGSNILTATTPPNGNVAPPGYYMLFVVDMQGRPCEYAQFVRVGGVVSMFTNRSHFSLHEVEALRPSGGYVPQAFYVVLDGFSANDLSSPDRLFPPSSAFHFTDNNSSVPGLSAGRVDILYESPTAPPDVTQRITLGFHLQFDDTHAFDGISAGEPRNIRIDIHWGPSHTSGLIYVFHHEHVYALDGAVPWLSVDVRVTRIQRRRPNFLEGILDDDPIAFVQAAVNSFRSLPNNNVHPFLQLSLDPEVSKLELSPTVHGVNIDNFAFAKVRFLAPAGIAANDVRVFFRLFTTAVTHLEYDDTTIYQHTPDGTVALEGRVGGETASIPFFATARSADPNTQPDPTNVVPATGPGSLIGVGATEVVTYFGCWLDFNHNLALRNTLRGRHQCLVAEIHYPLSLIQQGASPANNDQLSQRNLAIVESDNPGGPTAHLVTHTFELKPSPKHTLEMAMFNQQFPSDFKQRQMPPDELCILWNDLPEDTIATIYLPDVDIQEMLALASLRSGMGSLAAVDDHTVQCRIGDITYLPLPGGEKTNLAGLITLQLPPTVQVGKGFHVSVHQISGQNRKVIGSFEISIPVSRAELLVHDAERELGVLQEIETTIPAMNRWKPIFARYLETLADRVRGLGGNPNPMPHPQKDNGHDKHLETVVGKVVVIHYDYFGDFRGFVIETCEGRHTFIARERTILDVIREASLERLVVSVRYSPEQPERVQSIDITYA